MVKDGELSNAICDLNAVVADLPVVALSDRIDKVSTTLSITKIHLSDVSSAVTSIEEGPLATEISRATHAEYNINSVGTSLSKARRLLTVLWLFLRLFISRTHFPIQNLDDISTKRNSVISAAVSLASRVQNDEAALSSDVACAKSAEQSIVVITQNLNAVIKDLGSAQQTTNELAKDNSAALSQESPRAQRVESGLRIDVNAAQSRADQAYSYAGQVSGTVTSLAGAVASISTQATQE